MLLPGEPLLNGIPSSKMCTTLEEITEALDEAERVHVRVQHFRDTRDPMAALLLHLPSVTWWYCC